MPQTRRITRSSVTNAAETSQDEPPKKLRTPRARASTQEKGTEGDGLPPSRRAKVKHVSKPETFIPRVKSLWKVGAHVSASGGVENAVTNAAKIGANAFALFLKSQRKWTSPALTEESIKLFKERMKEHEYSAEVVLPHGSYLINLGNPDQDKREKAFECFLDDLKRCELLGLKYYNFHPGSTVGNATKEESISLIAQCINRAHRETKYVVTVVENMAGAGNAIGGDFMDLHGIINEVEDKSRVGVCLDTCHTFASGYDLRTETAWNEMMTKFDEQVGLSYLRGMHLNDSKTELGSKKDRHENIGLGFLALGTFRHLMNDPRVQNIPMILETPSFELPVDVWAKEIAVLQQLSATTTKSKDNGEALRSVIGEARTDEALTDVVKAAVRIAEGAKGKKEGTGKTQRSRKRKRDEEDGEDEENE
ncbi:AP endonuclease [Macrolepiota fuliginosa MF-IS2]|uniref:Apurinic-apyrimidinic endonuclease 1 n=1 Tax=Macrolepiota fuliginosa MF-IS2 TaxID=1400762 RepID=A0A9P5XEE0_9AGAR|nr:AP endonuclease [Macrolepiota fuliginosa MF-IS2]